MNKIRTGIYRHYKGANYRVVGIARHSETLEELVVYESLEKGGLWVRPLQMFLENVIVDGKDVSRFMFTGESLNLEE
jgi:cyclomaltodextrinase / maltogenic alpha-amylase / neopullulanase